MPEAYRISLNNGADVVSELEPSCLMVFIDETGHELFADSKYPLFGLGGCAILATSYISHLSQPWRKLKADFFDGTDMPLHAHALRNPSPLQLSALNKFFIDYPFCRVASVITDKAAFPSDMKPYQITTISLAERIRSVAQWQKQMTSIALIFEQSDRGDQLAVKYFTSIQMRANDFGKEIRIPINKYTMPKSAVEPGLEVADFIMHAAGTAMRACLAGQDGRKRKDFVAVFGVDEKLANFMEITRVDKNPVN